MCEITLVEHSNVIKWKLEQWLENEDYVTSVTEDIENPGLLQLASYHLQSKRRSAPFARYLCGYCLDFRRNKKHIVKSHLIAQVCQKFKVHENNRENHRLTTRRQSTAAMASSDNEFESMKNFQKYIPFLVKNKERLEKKRRFNNTLDTNKKLSVVEKYLQIIEAEANLPVKLAKRMETALEDMLVHTIKNDDKSENQSHSSFSRDQEKRAEFSENSNSESAITVMGDKVDISREFDESFKATNSILNSLESYDGCLETSNNCEPSNSPNITNPLTKVPEVISADMFQTDQCNYNELVKNFDTESTSYSDDPQRSVEDNMEDSISTAFNPIIKNCESISLLNNSVNTEPEVIDVNVESDESMHSTNCNDAAVTEKEDLSGQKIVPDICSETTENVLIDDDSGEDVILNDDDKMSNDDIRITGETDLNSECNLKIGQATSLKDCQNDMYDEQDKNVWNSVILDLKNRTELECPQCPDFRDATACELKYHLYHHAGYQPCSCDLCTSREMFDGKEIPNNLDFDIAKHCTKNADIELEISDLIAAIATACETRAIKRKIQDTIQDDCKRMRYDDDTEENGFINQNERDLNHINDDSGKTSFPEALHMLVARLDEMKHRSKPPGYPMNVYDEEIGMTDATINEKLEVKVEKDPLIACHLPRPNPFGSMDNDSHFDDSSHSETSFAVSLQNIKVEQSEMEDSTEDGMSSPIYGEDFPSMPLFKTPKKSNRKGTPTTLTNEFYPYECSFCGNCYKSLSTYRLHTYRHFKDYSVYRCGHCNRGFMRRDHLKSHMQGAHPFQEVKFEQIDPPDDPVILLTIPKPRNSSGMSTARIATVSELFKCAFCELICVPGDMAGHFQLHHPKEVPQMRMLKDSNVSSERVSSTTDLTTVVKKVVARKSTAAKSAAINNEPVRRSVAFKSTSKKSQFLNVNASGSSDNAKLNYDDSQLYGQLKIWNRSRSIYLPVKDLMKMINLNCSVRLVDISEDFFVF